MPAALLMAGLSSEVRLLLDTEARAIGVMGRLNRSLCETNVSGRFVTFLLAMLDGKRHELTVLNAGHPWAMIRRCR